MAKTWLTRALKLFVIGALIATFMPAAQAVVSISSCGHTITTDAVLTQDLTCTANDGVTLNGNPGYTLDLAGHTITGDNTHIGLIVSADAITIENGTIRSFDLGIDTGGTGSLTLKSLRVASNVSGGARIENASSGLVVDKSFFVFNGGDGLSIDDSGLFTIANSTLSRNLGDGVHIDGSDDGSITKSRIVGNGGHGVNFNMIGGSASLADDNLISGSTISANALDGIRLDIVAQATNVTANVICGNGGSGVRTEGTSTDNNVVQKNKDICGNSNGVLIEQGHNNRVVGNTIRSNRGSGVFVEGVSTGTVVEKNKASFNLGTGIVADVSSVTVAKNTALANGGHGISAVAGVTDGGGNKATDNASLPQCQIVVCA